MTPATCNHILQEHRLPVVFVIPGCNKEAIGTLLLLVLLTQVWQDDLMNGTRVTISYAGAC